MVVKAVKLLVKTAVMIMAPGSVPAPPKARGREPPFFFFFLDPLPRWEKGFPSGGKRRASTALRVAHESA